METEKYFEKDANNDKSPHNWYYDKEKQQMNVINGSGKVTTHKVDPEELKVMGDIIRDLLEDR